MDKTPYILMISTYKNFVNAATRGNIDPARVGGIGTILSYLQKQT